MDALGPSVANSAPTAILEAVGYTAQRLVSSSRWEDAIPDVLERLGQATGSSRAHVFRTHRSAQGALLASQLFEWCAPGVVSFIDAEHLQDFDWEATGYGRWAEEMAQGQPILGLSRDFPPKERMELEAEGIVSTLSFPVFAGDEWWGTIGLDDCVHERIWDEGEVEALRSVAAVIGAEILRQRVEAAYRDLVEEGPLMTYQENLPDGSRANTDLRYLSPQVTEVLGYPPERWQHPEFWPSILHPEDREEVLKEDEETVRAELPFDRDYRVVAADGRIVWLHDRAIPIYDSRGRLTHWQGFMLDITRRKEAEAALAAAEERYRFLVERGPLATYLIRFPEYPDLHPVYLSPQFEQMFGYPLERWQETDFWDSVVHPDDLEMLRIEDMRAKDEGNFDLEYRIIAADGGVVWVHDKAEVITGDDGGQLWKGYLVDITQRHRAIEEREEAWRQERAAREQVEEVSGLKDVLLQAVSHDIRTPLTAILGMATTLSHPELDLTDQERLEFAKRIAANTTRLDRLVSDLLDLDRLSRGELHTNLLTVDLGAIATEVAAYVDPQSHEISLETVPTIVQADPAKVERIVDNLLGNALKHTPREARIWLRVEVLDRGGLIIVEDDGPGVPDEEREAIFDIYRRSSQAPGSGIGLSLVRRFAELHGGRAWVAERPGGGASFKVWLPQTPPP